MRRFFLVLLAVAAVSASCRTVAGDEDLSDPAVKARVEGVLRGRKDLDLKYVTVDVNAGVVTLSGLVPTIEQMRLIRKLAANVRGAEQVLSNLLVQE